MTINGAAALKRRKIGSIDAGKKADLVVLGFPSYQFLHYHFGVNIVKKSLKTASLYLINTDVNMTQLFLDVGLLPARRLRALRAVQLDGPVLPGWHLLVLAGANPALQN